MHWTIATEMSADAGYSAARIAQRNSEIGSVAAAFGFTSIDRLGFATTRLDTLPLADIVSAVRRIIQRVEPDVVYVPFAGDAHSDHTVVARAAAAAMKWFRAPSVRRIMAYEVISETGFALTADATPFVPNYYACIEMELARKLEILNLFAGELDRFPFPRSHEAVTALARWRGASAGMAAAEAFTLIQERIL